MSKKYSRGLGFVIYSLLASSLNAEESLPQPELSLAEDRVIQNALLFLQAETEVITVTKVAETLRKSGGTVTVIDAQEIQNMGARNLIDVLRTVPGIGVSQGRVGFYKIESRGITTLLSEKVLVMIDGHAVNNNLTNGGALSFESLIVDNIKRLEVVRGPSSALYGADALVAVINVITRGAEDLDGQQLSATVGEYGTQYNLLAGHDFGDLKLVANANYLETNGFRARIDADSLGASGVVKYPEERVDFNFKGEYKDLVVKAHYLETETSGFLNFTDTLANGSEQNYQSYFFDLAYAFHWGEHLTVKPRVYYDFFTFDNFLENFQARFLADSIKKGAEIQVNYDGFTDHVLIGGVLYEDQSQDNVKTLLGNRQAGFVDVSAIANFNKDVSRDFKAVYFEDIWDITDDLRLTWGGRYDQYSDFGGNFSPRASLSWAFHSDYDVKLLYGEAFRAPTFADQFNANQGALLGGSDLEPETIKTIELGLGAKIQDFGTLQLTGFWNSLENIITAAPGMPTMNRDEFRVYGLEVEGRFAFEPGINLRANYTYQQAEDRGTGSSLSDIATHKGNLLLDVHLATNYNLNTHIFFKGKTKRAPTDPRSDNKGYVITNLTLVAHQLIPGVDGLEGRFSVYNLFDQNYEDPSSVGVTDYPQADRSYQAQFIFKFW